MDFSILTDIRSDKRGSKELIKKSKKLVVEMNKIHGFTTLQYNNPKDHVLLSLY